jgi:hypothetical protein
MTWPVDSDAPYLFYRPLPSKNPNENHEIYPIDSSCPKLEYTIRVIGI